MQIFKTDKNLFWKNELKSWLGALTFLAVFYFILKLLYEDKDLFIPPVSLLLLKIGEWLTQYHVIEIRVDKQKDKLVFILNSRMSGREVKSYGLSEASSILVHRSGLKRFLSSLVTLKILLPPKRIFRITTRYGFSPDTLAGIDKAIKSLEQDGITN